MKKVIVTLLVLGILGAGGYGVYHHFFVNSSESDQRVSSTSEDAVYVDSVSTITGFGSGNGLIDRYGGEVEPQATLEVKLESERTVKECFVKEGDEVKEGDKLFEYDTQEDEDKLVQAEIDIERNKNDIDLSKKTVEQYEKEKAKASADDQLEYTTYILTEQNNIKKAEYEIKTLEHEIEQLNEAIADAVVTAEMGGIIQKISDPNENDSYSYSYSNNGDSAYITILAVGDFRIKGTVNEQNLNQIYEGMPVIVYSRVDNTKTWKGTIEEINTDNAQEEEDNNYYYYGMGGDSAGSSSYTFHVELESSEGLILGQHVYMEADAGQNEKKDGLWLEEYYIMQEEDHAYVWMANKSNLIEKHEITLGEYDEDLMKYEITGGLDAEDYIAYPSDRIFEGAPVIYNDQNTQDAGMMSGGDEFGSSGGEGMYDMNGEMLPGDDVDFYDGSGSFYENDGGFSGDGSFYADDGSF